MAIGESFASKEAGIGMTFSIGKDPAQFEQAISDARKELDKRFENVPVKLKYILDTTALQQAEDDIHKTIVSHQRIQTQGLAAVQSMVSQGVPLDYIAQSGSRYAKAGMAQLNAAVMASERAKYPVGMVASATSGPVGAEARMQLSAFSGSFTATTPAMSAAQIRAGGHRNPWMYGPISGPASVGMEGGQFTGRIAESDALLSARSRPQSQDDLVISTLSSLGKKGAMVGVVVAAAIASRAFGTMITSPLVMATHGGFDRELAQAAASKQLGINMLDMFGSIPIIGAGARAQAEFSRTQIEWGKDAARTNAVGPYEAGAMRASASGDVAARVAHERSAGKKVAEAAVETAMQKYDVAYASAGGPQAKETEKLRLALEVEKTKLSAYEAESKTLTTVATNTQAAQIAGGFASAKSSQDMGRAYGMKISGQNPIDVLSIEAGAESRALRTSQSLELAGMAPGDPLRKATLAKMGGAQQAFKAEKEWQMANFIYSAPYAGVYSGAEALGAGQISSLRQRQMRQAAGEMGAAIDGAGTDSQPILDLLAEIAKNTGSGTYMGQ